MSKFEAGAEKFKNVPFFLDRYRITEAGEIISSYTGKALCGWLNHGGYKWVALSKNGNILKISVARLICFIYVDGYKDNMEVNHKDGNKLNNCKQNLEWVTSSGNKLHAYRTGLCKKGRWHKISKNEYREIAKRIKDGETQAHIAKEYGVVPNCIRKGVKRHGF